MMSERKLEGRVVIITGSGSGLGAEAARVLATHGAMLAIVDIDGAAARRVASAIETDSGQALAVQTDVSSEPEVKAMVEAVVKRFGRVDVLHNNAAILNVEQRRRDQDVINMDVEAWDLTMAVNLRGAMLCTKYAVREMLKNQKGSVIFATSGLGVQGDLSLSAYAASKAALIMLSRSVAAQYGKQGIRSNALQIGLAPAENAHQTMASPVIDILREHHLTPDVGTPRQIADVVAFLASDESSFVTGSTLVADGGFSSHTPSLMTMKALFAQTGAHGM
jgi:NAD(P)-dependent dehydrogenase (short-subunit alcohol dehydrogenase family)